MEFTRADWVAEMQSESKAALKFIAKAEELISENRIGTAIAMLDNAVMATKCAMQAHEKFWELQNDDITEEEFEAFDLAEQVQNKVRVAVSKFYNR